MNNNQSVIQVSTCRILNEIFHDVYCLSEGMRSFIFLVPTKLENFQIFISQNLKSDHGVNWNYFLETRCDFEVENFQNGYKFLIQRPRTVSQFLNKSGVQSTFKQIISLIIIWTKPIFTFCFHCKRIMV